MVAEDDGALEHPEGEEKIVETPVCEPLLATPFRTQEDAPREGAQGAFPAEPQAQEVVVPVQMKRGYRTTLDRVDTDVSQNSYRLGPSLHPHPTSTAAALGFRRATGIWTTSKHISFAPGSSKSSHIAIVGN